MARSRFILVPELSLEALEFYHNDVLASLRQYFSPASAKFTARFSGQSLEEVAATLRARLLESDIRSALAVLTSLEAHFRRNFDLRCRRRLKDDLSRYFRGIEKSCGERIRLDDILEGWKEYTDAPGILIAQLRGAFKLRHWLAHGKYWLPKLGNKYDFDGVYLMASIVISAFPFVG